METLKITQIGNSLGMILSKEILARLKVEKGDQIFLPEAPHVVAGHNTEEVFAAWFEPHIALKDKH